MVPTGTQVLKEEDGPVVKSLTSSQVPLVAEESKLLMKPSQIITNTHVSDSTEGPTRQPTSVSTEVKDVLHQLVIDTAE